MIHVPNKYRFLDHPTRPSTNADGNNGFFIIPHNKIRNYEYRIMVSDGWQWEHVSISVAEKKKDAKRCPTWEEMCYIKDLLWDEEDVVVQYHPRKSEYVNMHKYVLHLWRPTQMKIPTPPSIMVGI